MFQNVSCVIPTLKSSAVSHKDPPQLLSVKSFARLYLSSTAPDLITTECKPKCTVVLFRHKVDILHKSDSMYAKCNLERKRAIVQLLIGILQGQWLLPLFSRRHPGCDSRWHSAKCRCWPLHKNDSAWMLVSNPLQQRTYRNSTMDAGTDVCVTVSFLPKAKSRNGRTCSALLYTYLTMQILHLRLQTSFKTQLVLEYIFQLLFCHSSPAHTEIAFRLFQLRRLGFSTGTAHTDWISTWQRTIFSRSASNLVENKLLETSNQLKPECDFEKMICFMLICQVYFCSIGWDFFSIILFKQNANIEAFTTQHFSKWSIAVK